MLGVEAGHGSSGAVAFAALALGTALTLLGLGLVQAATATALVELDADRHVGPVRAYRLSLVRVGSLFKALLVAVAVVSLLTSSLYLLPIAIWLAGRWALVAPVVELERAGSLAALRRSRRLVSGQWLKVTTLVVAGGGLVVLLGPLVGTLLLGTSAPFWLERRRGSDLRAGDALRRAHDRVPLLRLPRPRRAAHRGVGTGSRPRSCFLAERGGELSAAR